MTEIVVTTTETDRSTWFNIVRFSEDGFWGELTNVGMNLEIYIRDLVKGIIGLMDIDLDIAI